MSPVLFYDGDSNGNFILDVHVYSVGVESFRDYLYSDLTVPAGQTWTVTGMFGNFANADPAASTLTPNFQYEIRTGMSGPSAGTLVSSGTDIAPATATNLNQSISGWATFAYSIHLPTPVTLTGGTTYWVSLVPISEDGYNMGLLSTSHVNSINSLQNNQNVFLSWNYLDQTNGYTPVSSDASIGLTGTSVPEPTALGLLALAGAAMLARRRAWR